jgi:hypothetical protein
MDYSNTSLKKPAVVSSEERSAGEFAEEKGRDAERQRILKLIHDEVSPKLLAAVFTSQVTFEKLEAKGFQERETVAQTTAAIIEAIDRLVLIFDSNETSRERFLSNNGWGGRSGRPLLSLRS